MGPAALLCLVLVVLCCTKAWSCRPTVSDTTTVFKQGENGYACFRIPALVRLPGAGLLVVAEGRKLSCSDHGYVDLVSKWSADGKSWSNFTVIHSESSGKTHVTCGNPAPVVDTSGETPVLLLAFCRNNIDVFVLESNDLGRTWSTARNITQSVKPPHWTWYATGPPGGIQAQDGSLIVFADHIESGVSYSHVIASTDHGRTWMLRGSIKGGNENQGVQLHNGSLLTNMRSADRSVKRRLSALSNDMGRTWSAAHDMSLIDPVCEGSTIACASKDSTTWIVTSNAASTTSRTNMTVSLSADAGAHWTSVVSVWSGPSAYSSLQWMSQDASAGSSTIGLAWERGVKSAYETISFVTVSFCDMLCV